MDIDSNSIEAWLPPHAHLGNTYAAIEFLGLTYVVRQSATSVSQRPGI